MRLHPERARVLQAALLAFGVAFAVYANSLANGFAYDDVPIIAENERVHQLRDLGEIWLTPYWPFTGQVLGAYRPLTIFSFALQWAVSGGAPWFFHLVNVLLHGTVTVLVFLLLRRLFGTGAALAGAVVFAVHPVHTEAVANVVGQAELLAAAAVLAACLIHLGADPERGLTRKRLAAILLCYALGLLAKESAVVLPGLLVLLDVVRGRVEWSRRGLGRYAAQMSVPIAALTAVLLAYLNLRFEVLGTITAADPNPSLSFLKGDERVPTALRAWPEFARLLFFPADLSADYSPAVILPVESWTPMALLGAILLATTAGTTLAAARYPTAGCAAGWFLLSILPVSNLFFYVGILVAERTLYLPSVAVSVLVAGGWQALGRIRESRARTMAVAAGVLAVLLLAARTVTRNPDWKDTDAVFQALYRDHPESYRPYLQFAIEKMQEGDTVASRRYWEFAYRLWPRDPALLIQYAFANYGWGRYDRTIELLEEAASLHPGYHEARVVLGMAYVQAGQYEKALGLTDALFRRFGPRLVLLDIRGRALAGLGRDTLAATVFRAAARQPGGDNWAIWTLLARSLARAGFEVEAAKALDTARLRAAGDTAALRRIDAFLAGEGALPAAADSANALQNAIEMSGASR